MDVQDVIAQARDTLTVKRVFGEPYEKDGATIIPAARIQGGAGGGSGEDPQGQGKGSGSGFGITARPVGAFVIRDGQVSWRPAVDVTRIVLEARWWQSSPCSPSGRSSRLGSKSTRSGFSRLAPASWHYAEVDLAAESGAATSTGSAHKAT